MLRHVVGVTLALALVAGIARAHSIQLGAGDCAGLAAASSRSAELSCDGNTGSPLVLVASVRLSSPLPRFDAASAIIEFDAAGGAVPDWWRLDADGCRRGGYAGSNWSGASGGSCPAIWTPGFQAGMPLLWIERWELVPEQAGRIRYTGCCAFPDGVDVPAVDPATGGDEWGVVTLSIGYGRTTGMGACAGCATPVNVTLRDVGLYFVDFSPAIHVGTPGAPGATLSVNPGGASNSVTAARNTSWGRLKSLYR